MRKIHRDIISIITPMFMLGCMGDFSKSKEIHLDSLAHIENLEILNNNLIIFKGGYKILADEALILAVKNNRIKKFFMLERSPPVFIFQFSDGLIRRYNSFKD